jgi:cellulose synthase/poly-beta-1,6-N-acetylglucosamine synthase-like glycosyltransferase
LIRKKGYRTIVNESVKAEEEIPDNFALRRKQRDRRAQGIIKAMMKNKEIFYNRKFGKYGSIVFPMELFIIGLSPFFLMAIAGVSTYILYQINPLFLGLLAIPVLLFVTKSKILFSALDTQISGLIATSKYILGKDEPLWSKVR